MKILDTHQHLFFRDLSYKWVDQFDALRGQPLGLDEYHTAARGSGIDKSLFMEVDVDDPHIKAEIDHVLRIAEDSSSAIAGAIASCRPESPDFPAYLKSILHPKLKGLRRILHVHPDELSQSSLFAQNLALLAPHHLTFDLCLLARQLPLAAPLLQRLPNQQFILDHCGVPNIKDNELDPWRKNIRELSKFPNLACKISGVVAYCHPQRVTVEAIKPYVDHCLECFGWDRVVFGGDWPVCNLTASLGRWVEIAREILSPHPAAQQEKLFSKNAERIYRVSPSP